MSSRIVSTVLLATLLVATLLAGPALAQYVPPPPEEPEEEPEVEVLEVVEELPFTGGDLLGLMVIGGVLVSLGYTAFRRGRPSSDVGGA